MTKTEPKGDELARLRKLVKAQKVEIELLKALDKSNQAQLQKYEQAMTDMLRKP